MPPKTSVTSAATVNLKDYQDKSRADLIAALEALSARVPILEYLALENARAQKVQEALYRIADVTVSAHSMPDLYDAIHAIIQQLMPAKNCIIAMYDEDDQTISLPYFVDEREYEPQIRQPLPVARFLPTLTGYVFRTGEPLLADREKLSELERSGEVIRRGPLSDSWLGVPFKHEGKVLGAIVLQSYDSEYSYGKAEKELLMFVSQQIATAIVRKRSEQVLKQAYDELEGKIRHRTAELIAANQVLEQEVRIRQRAEELQAVLYRIAHLTNSSIQLDEFFAAVHEYVGQLVYAKNFFIALRDKHTEVVSFRYCVDAYANEYSPRDFSLHDDRGRGGLTERVLRSREALLVTRERADFAELMQLTCGKPAISWLGIPLFHEQEAIGVLGVQSYDENIQFNEQDCALLTFVGEHISAALQRKQDADLLKLAHAELKLLNDELEKRIDQRTRELTDTNRRLNESLLQRQSIQDRLAYAACHDSLTGLPNRNLLLDRLQNAIGRGARATGLTYAVLFLDLDRFKVINDSLGHHVGDGLLVEVARRLVECVRPGDTVARLGGDEFCILLENISSETQAVQAAQRIIQVLASAIKLNEQKIFVSTSIGIALSAGGYNDASTVLRDADTAMYQAKASGTAQYAIFNPEMYERVASRLKLESELRLALQQQTIEVAFQPIVDLRTGKAMSFEVLARWQHPELGSVSPAEFIRLAEETGLIGELGMQILDKAMQCMANWRQQYHIEDDVYFCANLSAAQFSQPGLLESIVEKLAYYRIPAHCLRMEVTESMFINNLRASRNLLSRFNHAAICVVLDDFGTGYSSLSYLHKLPFSALKIDRSFIHDLENNRDSETIVRTINSLAENLGMSVVAEGIETEAQLEIVKSMGVCFGQGYLFSRPMLRQDAEQYIARTFSPAAA